MIVQLGYDVIKELTKRGHTAIGFGDIMVEDMKVFIIGVGVQLGLDVVNELEHREKQSIGSDFQENYCAVVDGTPVITVPYVKLDKTN